MKLIRKKWKLLWLIISITLLLVNASVVLINSFRVDKLNKKKEQILIMMKNVDDLQNSTIHGMDLGIRGYAISMKKEMLAPFVTAISFNDSIFQSLYQQAELFQYPKENVDSLHSIMSGYINLGIYLKILIDQDSITKFKYIVSTDPGLVVWQEYSHYRNDLFLHLGKARNELDKEIESSLFANLVLQALVILLIIPSIILIFFKLNTLKKDIGNKNTIVIQKKSELQNSRDFLSHTIRGPICRLQGLFYLLERDKVTEKKLLLEKIEQVAFEIDQLTKGN